MNVKRWQQTTNREKNMLNDISRQYNCIVSYIILIIFPVKRTYTFSKFILLFSRCFFFFFSFCVSYFALS